jgi:hypothetical protein
VKEFLINQMVRFVFLAEAFEDSILMLPNPAMEIARNADIKAAGLAAHDVNPPAFLNHIVIGARSFDSGSAWALGEQEVFRSPSLRMTEFI